MSLRLRCINSTMFRKPSRYLVDINYHICFQPNIKWQSYRNQLFYSNVHLYPIFDSLRFDIGMPVSKMMSTERKNLRQKKRTIKPTVRCVVHPIWYVGITFWIWTRIRLTPYTTYLCPMEIANRYMGEKKSW